jgi:hypothetical protein
MARNPVPESLPTPRRAPTEEAPELERIRSYRRAARHAVEADATAKSCRLALIDLAKSARKEVDPFVRAEAGFVIWEESKAFLGEDDDQHSFPPDAYEEAQRRVRAKGYTRCPECAAELATEADFERWARQKAEHLRELWVREQAVDR